MSIKPGVIKLITSTFINTFKEHFLFFLLPLPKRSVQGSVPADEGAGCEKDEPEDGQAEVHAARCIHAEPGQAADHVGEQRHSMNWGARRNRQ